MRIHISTRAILGLSATAAFIGTGHAQPLSPAEPAALEESDEAEATGDIIVTAQRRSELQRDVPISITSINAGQLTQSGVQDLTGITKLTPGLRLDYATGGFVQPTIRGIGTSFATPGSGANVGIYVDGFYSPNPTAGNLQLLNVQSIQVLKGPQGTLFGRNTTGGAILVTSAEPSTEAHSVAEASYGSYDAIRLQGYATGGLSDRIAVDAEGLYRRGDGFIRNLLTGRKDGRYENWAVKIGFKAELGDDVSVLLRYLHSEDDDGTPVAQGNFTDPSGRVLTVGAVIPGVLVAPRRGEVANDARTSLRNNSDAVQLTVKADLGFADLTSYSQYRKDASHQVLDLDRSSAAVFVLDLPIRDRTVTQEFILNSKEVGRLRWTAGLFYFDYVDTYPNTRASIGGAPFVQFASSSATTRSVAAFADATYEVTAGLFLTAGLRYSHDQVINAYFRNFPAAPTPVPAIKADRVTPRVVLRYKPDDRSSVYASFTRGYKPAILNVGGGQLADIYVAPERISAWEAGYKFGSRGFSFETSAFYYDYKNLQVSSYTGTQSLITNAATSRIYGVEAQVQGDIASGLRINAGGAYVNGKYRRFLTAPRYDQCLAAACGDGFGLFAISINDASGNRMLRTPKFTGNVGITYTAALASGRLTLSGNAYYSSKFYFDASNQFAQKGHGTIGLRAEWTDPSDRFTFAIFGDNVTDTRYRVQADYNFAGVGTVWGTPATVGGSVRVKM